MMKMHYPNYLLLVAGLACFSQDVLGAHDLSQEYRFSVALAGEDYILYWTANLLSKEIRFAVNVSTTGWVGFGLSPNGQMPGSDVVIGWVDSSSKVMFHDRYAEGRFLPAIDDSQDWFLTSGLEENGRTILEFKRNLTTCDEYDMDIMADTARIIWSYDSRDPSSPEELGKLQHTRQGSASLNLLGGLQKERVEENSGSFTLLNDNVTIPSHKDTTYWCTVHAMPQELQQQERYMYKRCTHYRPTCGKISPNFKFNDSQLNAKTSSSEAYTCIQGSGTNVLSILFYPLFCVIIAFVALP